MWPLLGRIFLALVKNPVKTTVGAGLIDQFATGGRGREAALDAVTPDWMKTFLGDGDGSGIWDKLQEFLGKMNLGGGIGAGIGFLMSGEGMLNKAVCTLAAGLIGQFLYSAYLKSNFNSNSGAESPNAEMKAEPETATAPELGLADGPE